MPQPPFRHSGATSFVRGALLILTCDYAVGAATFLKRILRGDLGERFPIYAGAAIVCFVTTLGFGAVFVVLCRAGAWNAKTYMMGMAAGLCVAALLDGLCYAAVFRGI